MLWQSEGPTDNNLPTGLVLQYKGLRMQLCSVSEVLMINWTTLVVQWTPGLHVVMFRVPHSSEAEIQVENTSVYDTMIMLSPIPWTCVSLIKLGFCM